jgi:hypothetical protein
MYSTNFLQEIYGLEKKKHGFFHNSRTTSRGHVNQPLFLKSTSHWSIYIFKPLTIKITELKLVSLNLSYMETVISLWKKKKKKKKRQMPAKTCVIAQLTRLFK